MKQACSHNDVNRVLLPEYRVNGFQGLEVVVYNAAVQLDCRQCGRTIGIDVPNRRALEFAVALERAKVGPRLRPAEIRLVRKALGLTGKDLANQLSVTPETVSRWENGKLPMSPSSEKLLRVMAGLGVRERVPAADFDLQAILDLDLSAPLVARDTKRLRFGFELVKVQSKKEKVYEAVDAVAA